MKAIILKCTHLLLNVMPTLVFGRYSSSITQEIMKVCEPHGFSVLAAGTTSDQLWQEGQLEFFAPVAIKAIQAKSPVFN